MRLLALASLGLGAVALGVGSRWVDPVAALEAAGYWWMLALVLGSCAAALFWFRRHWPAWRTTFGWNGLMWVLAAWLFLITREPAEFKIVMDEPMLMSTSMALYQDRTPVIARAVYELAGQREVQPGQIDKRPLLFPFLVSLLHDALGYRVANAFLLNKALVLALLVFAWAAGRALDPVVGGPLVLLWFCGWPLVSQNACGGGFEILNLALLLLLFLAARRYLADRCPANEVFLLATCLLLANTRYESVLYLLVFAALWLIGAIRAWDWSVTWATVCSPLFLLPYLWQHSAVMGVPDRWELRALQTDHMFGFDYLTENLSRAWRFFLTPSRELAGSPLFGALGLLALLAWGAGWLWRRRVMGAPDRSAWAALAVLLLPVGGGFGVLLFFFYGHLDDPVTSRLALPLIGAMGLALCAVRPVLLPSPAGRRLLIGAMGLWFVGYVLPTVNEHRYTQNGIHMRIFDWSQEVIARTGAKRPLVIGLHARIWTAYRAAALTPAMAWGSMEQIDYQRQVGTFDDVFVIQSLIADADSLDYVPLSGNRLPDGVGLDPVAESSFHPFNHVRVSRVRGIDLARVKSSVRCDEPAVVFQDVTAEQLGLLRERLGWVDKQEGPR